MGHYIDNSVKELQQQVLQYLGSDDLTTDPHQLFQETSKYGYPSLEWFIQSIHVENFQNFENFSPIFNAAYRLGTRFVLKTDPKKRGKLRKVHVLEDPNGNTGSLIELEMDTPQVTIWQPIYFISSYLARLLSYVKLQALVPFSRQNLVEEYYLHDVVLEKEFLRGLVPIPPEVTTISNVSNSVIEEFIRYPPIPTVVADTHFNNGKQKEDDSISNFSSEKLNTAESVPVVLETQVEDEPKSETGTFRGIHGEYNSCYLDSLLFSLFYGTTIFDKLLISKGDNEYATRTRQLLGNIVNSLRQDYYCSGEQVMEFREHLSEKNESVMGSFMDVEEIYYLIVQDILKERHFIKYGGFEDDTDDWGDWAHLMGIDVDDPLKVITVERNLENSLQLNGNLKMKRVPSPALVLGLPRSERKLVNYEAVMPDPELKIGSLLVPQNCVCGNAATWELIELKGKSLSREKVTFLCDTCTIEKAKAPLNPKKIKLVSRQEMKLLAIMCIRGAHFVAFSRSKKNTDQWLFFDSMAGGYPEVTTVPEMDKWLRKFSQKPEEFSENEVPFPVQRAFTDGHICVYEPVQFIPTRNIIS